MTKTIIITGASRGIGAAIAKSYAQTGCNLVLNCAQNHEQLKAIQAECIAAGSPTEIYVGDISSPDVAKAVFSLAHSTFGPIDVLVNNAGISMVGLFQDMTHDEWNRIMNVNVGSIFNCCQLAIPDMLTHQAGRIINISSVWGNVGASCEVAYSATKGAVNALTKALAKELAPSNIAVNAIACGAIDTDMNRFLNETDRQALAEEIPVGRMATPEEVAQFALQLLEAPSYLTGQIITLDGGWT